VQITNECTANSQLPALKPLRKPLNTPPLAKRLSKPPKPSSALAWKLVQLHIPLRPRAMSSSTRVERVVAAMWIF
jgi:hypothetical protein